MKQIIFVCSLLVVMTANGQLIRGVVRDRESKEPVSGATVRVPSSGVATAANVLGEFSIEGTDSAFVVVSAAGFASDSLWLYPSADIREIDLRTALNSLEQVVVTGTMRSVQRSATPVPVEVYNSSFFLKNPTPTIFDALQLVNGVRPQMNCNVCNTGDIHINGLEGPYTMVLIDGMPIVSSLASVYGLFGIPNSLVERIEVVRGPASSLYGSEAIGGLINVITKNPLKAPLFSIDVSSTSWGEHNADIGVRYRIGNKVNGLTGINYYNYSNPIDRNNDNFTDVTLQKRVSVFNKLQFIRSKNRISNLAMRYSYEDRWGGDMRWNSRFRGTDSIYGESIYTSRWELIGNHQLVTDEKLLFSYSLNSHSQRSAYGNMIFNAIQNSAFGQLTWEKNLTNHDMLFGVTSRYTFYDDNTTATIDTAAKRNRPDHVYLPGVFVQDEIDLKSGQRLLLGVRYDYDRRHGNIFTPRIGYKIGLGAGDILRFNAGTGFRVVNLFTEDHAALSGARAVEITENLKPERSVNMNLNYLKNITLTSGYLQFEMSAWYSRFANRILPDYETDPNKIIYSNLNGHSVSKGVSLNAEMNFSNRLVATIGGTVMDVSVSERNSNGEWDKRRQLLTETWTGTWTLTYNAPSAGLKFDYTGNIYGPMDLPLLSELDPRSPRSPVWSIQNIQLTKRLSSTSEIYMGVKNLLNWTPARNNPLLIPRTNDPFDKQVQFDQQGRAVATADNPYALTFDPSYVYAPNQGLRIFAGYRLNIRKQVK